MHISSLSCFIQHRSVQLYLFILNNRWRRYYQWSMNPTPIIRLLKIEIIGLSLCFLVPQRKLNIVGVQCNPPSLYRTILKTSTRRYPWKSVPTDNLWLIKCVLSSALQFNLLYWFQRETFQYSSNTATVYMRQCGFPQFISICLNLPLQLFVDWVITTAGAF